MSPREFPAGSDEEALTKAREILDTQRKSDPEGTAGIVYLLRIDVEEQTTRIRTN